jgi:hypothetical protein
MSEGPDAMTTAREVWRFTRNHPFVRRASFVCMGCAGLALAAVAFAFPAWREARSIEAALAAHYEQVARERDHDALVQAVRRATTEIDVTEKKLAIRTVQTTLVNQLNGIARRHGVRILHSSYEEAKAGNGNPPLIHELAAEGDYAALRRFVSDLRTMPTLTVIREASLTVAGDNAARLTARLRMATYRKTHDGP